jgi:mannosyltransferase
MLTPVRTDATSVARTDSLRRPERISADVVALVALTVLGAVLRFATIAHQSYWVDEATTVHELRLSLGGLLHEIRVNETTPPLYFLVAWVWAKVFGTGEAGLRSLSALFGIGLIPLAYLCARELISRWAGVLAAAFAAVSPFLIWYSQEARAYAMFAVFCGLSFLFFVRQRRGPNRRDLVLWTVFSVLAVLTHFFAGFLVAPEAVALLWWQRSRAVVVAVAVVALVQAALLPLAAGDTGHPLGWIKEFPLSVRIKQVPVDFALSSLYQSQAVTYGLTGAAVMALAVAGLLAFGGGPRRRRGALLAVAVAAVVVLVPMLLAAFGRDYVVPRNFIGAWIPLIVVIAAACTAPRTLPFGALLAAALLGAFIYAGVKVDSDAQYQRPNWRGVARALGTAAGPRAIVAYDAGFASQPLTVYLPGIPWQQLGGPPVTVGEVDIVGSPFQTTPTRLPGGVTRMGRTTVGAFLVERFAVRPAWHLTPQAIGARAGQLLGPAPTGPAVLIQRHGT